MSENPGECAYQYCTKPQSEHTYYLCEKHYQQAWDNVLSKSPARNKPSEPGRKREFKPYVCKRGHHVDPADRTSQIAGRSMKCRACDRARIRMFRKNNKNPEAMNELADEIYQEILTQIGKEGK